MKNLILGCLFLVPILFSNCKKGNDNIKIVDCSDSDVYDSFTLFLKKRDDFSTKLVDFNSDMSISNCNKAKTSGENLIRYTKKEQQGKCAVAYSNQPVYSALERATNFLNETDCSDF